MRVELALGTDSFAGARWHGGRRRRCTVSRQAELVVMPPMRCVGLEPLPARLALSRLLSSAVSVSPSRQTSMAMLVWPSAAAFVRYEVVALPSSRGSASAPAHFSDRGRWFQRDRGRRFKVIVDDHGSTRVKGFIVYQSSTIAVNRRALSMPASRVRRDGGGAARNARSGHGTTGSVATRASPTVKQNSARSMYFMTRSK